MTSIARKNLLADKLRLLISIGGVAFAVLLILVVKGLYEGFAERVGAFAETAPADVWVTERGERGFTYASNIPDARVAEIAAMDGVIAVTPLFAERIQVTAGDRRTDVYLLAFDPPVAIAGLQPDPGTIVIDRVFARDTGLEAGDSLALRNRTLLVTGVEELADAGLSQFAIISLEDARALYVLPGYVDYLLVQVAPDAQPAEVASAISDTFPDVQASTAADFAATNRTEVTATFRPVVGVLVVVVLVVGIAVVGLTIYTATIERAQEYGLLKAFGATTLNLFAVVLTQSLVICVTGWALGVPLAMLVTRIAEDSVPEFITLMRWGDVVLVLVAVLAMAVAAALIPVRRIAALDPAAVFRA